jgi:hypothetical protein
METIRDYFKILTISVLDRLNHFKNLVWNQAQHLNLPADPPPPPPDDEPGLPDPSGYVKEKI